MPDDLGSPFARSATAGPGVSGFLHRAAGPARAALVLTHGAGGSAKAPLLLALARAFAAADVAVLRCDLPFRQRRAVGPPSPATASADREGLARAVEALREETGVIPLLGGVSYGGRQASMLAAEHTALAAGLLLLSYPLHPPGRSAQQRTDHFPSLRIPALFVHGSRDPFGSVDEVRAALALIPAPSRLLEIEGAGHDLGSGRAVRGADVPPLVVGGALQHLVPGR
jgi:predicted alpha/beta-hydrolase family hydrolase